MAQLEERVKERVRLGGHNIPENVILCRYKNGIYNLIELYQPICNYWMIIDNSNSPFSVIAEGHKIENISITDTLIYQQILAL